MKNIILWGTPRSVSTAFEKAVSQHPRIKITHEPFAQAYYFSDKRKSDRYIMKNDQTFSKVIELELELEQDGLKDISFTKELAFQGEHYISDKHLASSKHFIIIRHPYLVYESLIKLKPDFTEEEFGFISIDKIIKKLDKLNMSPEFVIDGTDFQNNPAKVLEKFCNNIGLDFDFSMLRWDDSYIREWTQEEELSQRPWHKYLESSNEIIPSKTKINNTLDIDFKHRSIVDDAIVIYNKLKSLRGDLKYG